MDEEEGGKPRLSKRFSDKEGEVDYKTKSGTAWSHSYLNQKPWHPLSYPNQRRKWIAEQTHAQKERRAEEIAREYAQEQDFFRQTALVSKKEKEKMEMMKAVSFMYVRPPGYNPESAKAAEIADERKNLEQNNPSQKPSVDGAATSRPSEMMPCTNRPSDEKKKPRPKDVFGHALPTEEQFEVLKNAPRLDTGVAARSKPFGIEIRNVKCARCGNFGHQSGDRECPLKDVIMPNEESRLKRDDPLTAILAQTDLSEPLKWELKQKPGMSPPRGGFRPDDPNQQIVAEDIFDEYGGFLGVDNIPGLLTKVSPCKATEKRSRKSKHKRKPSMSGGEFDNIRERESSSEDGDRGRSKKKKPGRKMEKPSTSGGIFDKYKGLESSSEDEHRGRSKYKKHRRKRGKHGPSNSSSTDSDCDRHHKHRSRHRHSSQYSSEDFGSNESLKDKRHRRRGRSHRNSDNSSS